VLIAVATICLRYHYAIDLVAGLALALAASRIARRIHGSASRRARWRISPMWLWWRASLAVWFRRIEVEGLEKRSGDRSAAPGAEPRERARRSAPGDDPARAPGRAHGEGHALEESAARARG